MNLSDFERVIFLEKKLYRSKTDKKISGVCGGLAEYLAVDSTIIRILTVVAGLFSCFLVLFLYIACIFIIPEDSGYIEPEYREKE